RDAQEEQQMVPPGEDVLDSEEKEPGRRAILRGVPGRGHLLRSVAPVRDEGRRVAVARDLRDVTMSGLEVVDEVVVELDVARRGASVVKRDKDAVRRRVAH